MQRTSGGFMAFFTFGVPSYFFPLYASIMSQDSSVGIAVGYGLEGPISILGSEGFPGSKAAAA
jgi:hypothetical protein